MALTLKEELAIAILRGDETALNIIVDLIIEERTGIREQIVLNQTNDPVGRPTGYEVYHWPEFYALLTRLGIDPLSRTISISLELTRDEIKIVHNVQGQDHGPTTNSSSSTPNV